MGVTGKIVALGLLALTVIFSFAGCGGSPVSQEDYDNLKSQLDAVSSSLTAVQNKLTEATALQTQYQAQYEELKQQYQQLEDDSQTMLEEIQNWQTKYDDLNQQYEALQASAGDDTALEALQDKYDALQADFDALQGRYEAVLHGMVDIDSAEIEQAIFDMVNQARIANGADALLYGKNTYKWAAENSRAMANKKEYVYSEWASWQELFWGINYGTVEQLANGALTIWKSNQYRYDYNILNPQCIYGAVAAYKSGDIYYITYMASLFE